VATRGTDLLRQKLVILAQEGYRLRLLDEATRREWRDADREARRWLMRAAAAGGERAIRLVAPPDPATVEVRWTAVMGVPCPAEADVVPPVERPERAPPSGLALARAEAAYRTAARAAGRHAAAAAARAAIEDATAATRQRVRALEYHWIPQLRDALSTIQLQMAELEDADSVRRRRAGRPDPHRRVGP
jgi:vacuolar-type H+-ATPase subunit D/Vma8